MSENNAENQSAPTNTFSMIKSVTVIIVSVIAAFMTFVAALNIYLEPKFDNLEKELSIIKSRAEKTVTENSFNLRMNAFDYNLIRNRARTNELIFPNDEHLKNFFAADTYASFQKRDLLREFHMAVDGDITYIFGNDMIRSELTTADYKSIDAVISVGNFKLEWDKNFDRIEPSVWGGIYIKNAKEE